MGVAPRRLWGWEPRETTTYRYGQSGRLTSAVTVREPEFDTTQYELLAACAELEADTGRLGELLSEALSPAGDITNRARLFHYQAGINGMPLTNHAALAAETAQKKYYETYPDADRSAHVWPVRKVMD